MGLDMNDFVKYVENFKEMEKEFDDFLKKWITQQGSKLLANTKARTPVDTGNLRNSWSLGEYERQGNVASIGINNSAEYASIIEYGTPKRPNWKWSVGAHMLTISMNEILRDMPDLFDKAFSDFLKSKGIA